MQIEYQITLEDLVDFNLYHYKNSPAMRRSILSMKMAFAVTIILIAPLILYFLDEISFLISVPVLAVLAFISAFIWPLPRVIERSIEKQAVKLYAEGKKDATGKHTMTLTPDGIIETGEHGEQRIKWGGVEKITVNEKYIFIYISSIQAFIVPRTSFDDEFSFQAFINTLNRHYKIAPLALT